MALEPDSEPKSLADPDDYRNDHPAEDPRQWGWHGEWGGSSRVGGWVVALILVLMMTSTHYNLMGTLFLAIMAGALILWLIIDRVRRKNSWRG